MSEAVRCGVCLGSGVELFEDAAGNEEQVTCCRCKGSGAMQLRTSGPGYPPSDDPYEPVLVGVNW